MPALDTIASFQTTVNSTFAVGVMAPGDSANVRNFPPTAFARIVAAYYDDVTTPLAWRVRSPLLHDNVRGIQFNPGAAAPSELFPTYIGQGLQPQDALTFVWFSASDPAFRAAREWMRQFNARPPIVTRPSPIVIAIAFIQHLQGCETATPSRVACHKINLGARVRACATGHEI